MLQTKVMEETSDTLSNFWLIARIGGTIADGIAFLRYRVFITVVCLHKSSPATFEVSAAGESRTAAPVGINLDRASRGATIENGYEW